MLLAVVDRGAAAMAERALADELQRSGGLSSRPAVEVGGIPFLTQAVGGRYDRIDVVARDVDAGEVGGTRVLVPRLSATLRGVLLPLSDAVSGAVTQVPVDRVDALVLLPFPVLQRSSDVGDLTVAPAGDRLRVRGTLEVLGQELSASALSRLTVEDGAVVVTAERLEVGDDVVDGLLGRALDGRLDVRVPLRGLPYGLQVDAVTVRPDGLAVRAGATDAVLSAPAS